MERYVSNYYPTVDQMAIDGGVVGVNDVPMDRWTPFVLRSDYDAQLADAQATIAALQAQLNEQSEKLKYHDLFKQWQCWRDPDELVDEYEKWQAAIQEHQALKDQLTQRTVERDTARRRVDELEAREVDVVTLREDLEKRTAELEALKIHCAIVEEHKVIAYKDAANLQAELERVSLLSSHNERRFEEVDKKYKELRTLVLALPKVEYEIKASNFIAHIWPDHDTEEPLVDLRASVAALLKHRQGMEG